MLNAANAEMLNAANAGVNAGVLHSRCPDVRVRIRWCSPFGMPACPHLNAVAGCWYTAFVNAQSTHAAFRIAAFQHSVQHSETATHTEVQGGDVVISELLPGY